MATSKELGTVLQRRWHQRPGLDRDVAQELQELGRAPRASPAAGALDVACGGAVAVVAEVVPWTSPTSAAVAAWCAGDLFAAAWSRSPRSVALITEAALGVRSRAMSDRCDSLERVERAARRTTRPRP